MILADLGPVMPYALGALAGFLPGVAVGRVDWNQRVSYWRQRALFKTGNAPPPPGPQPAAVPMRLVEPTPTKPDTRTEAA